METENDKAQLRNNPMFVITIVLLIAIFMTAISMLIYYRSETRKTVEQIQANNTTELVSTPDNVPAELSEGYLDYVENKISEDVLKLDAETDYSPDELTDGALGL